MIFPKIQTDDIVQVSDKFRIDASRSYISKGEAAITKVEIEAESGSGFIEVTGSAPLNPDNWYLDWEYATAGSKVISTKITTDGSPTTSTLTVSALTSAVDKLFSDDDDLVQIEGDILRYLPHGRNTFKYIHREAQTEILEWLYTNGYVNVIDDTRLTKDAIIDIQEVNFWSKYLALRLIFQDISNVIGDVFDQKSKMYENDEHKWRQKAILSIDLDGDGTAGPGEGLNLTTRSLIRT